MRSHKESDSRRLPQRVPICVLSMAMLLTLGTTQEAAPDDRDLLKLGGGNPYLFLLLDTSASMNLKMRLDEPTAGFGDDPGSAPGRKLQERPVPELAADDNLRRAPWSAASPSTCRRRTP